MDQQCPVIPPGEPRNIQPWWQECCIHPFFHEGSAGLWALTKTETALARNPQSFGAWNDFLTRFNASFILENMKDQAIAWLSTAKVNEKLNLLKYISKFKNNIALSSIKNEDALINFFSWGIPTQIMKRIYFMDTVLNTIENGTPRPFTSNMFGKRPARLWRAEEPFPHLPRQLKHQQHPEIHPKEKGPQHHGCRYNPHWETHPRRMTKVLW